MNDKKSIIKRVANNILEFLIDPTVYPPERHIYFHPEEILDNDFYENAKKDSEKTYGDQRENSDFYPNRPVREASLMERKTLIASLDVLSQNFNESDPIAKDLRTMAYAISKMSEEELKNRLATDVEAKADAKVEKEKMDDEQVVEKEGSSEVADDKKVVATDYWTKEAVEAVRRTLIAEVKESCDDKKKKEDNEKEAAVPEKKEEAKEPVPEKKEEAKEPVPEKKEVEAKEPVPEKKEVEAKEEATKKVESSEKKADSELPSKDEKEATEVDTSLLNASSIFDGIEMQAGLVTTEDIGDLSDTEKERLNLLFK